MREFEHPNMDNFICPICKSSKDAPVVLVPIRDNGDGLWACNQVHSECYVLVCRMNGLKAEIEPFDKPINQIPHIKHHAEPKPTNPSHS